MIFMIRTGSAKLFVVLIEVLGVFICVFPEQILHFQVLMKIELESSPKSLCPKPFVNPWQTMTMKPWKILDSESKLQPSVVTVKIIEVD